jgi:hypothetical protein
MPRSKRELERMKGLESSTFWTRVSRFGMRDDLSAGSKRANRPGRYGRSVPAGISRRCSYETIRGSGGPSGTGCVRVPQTAR